MDGIIKTNNDKEIISMMNNGLLASGLEESKVGVSNERKRLFYWFAENITYVLIRYI